jgi:Domain of unknown function (DUF4159)
MRVRRRYVVAALLGVAVAALAAQRRNFFARDFPVEGNPSYDGRLTFARLRYEGYGGMTNEGPGWMHDYPMAERHLLKIMSELSDLRPRTDSSSVIDFGDPELMKYPIAYFSEPGYWQPTDEDVKNVHDYLLKGGFIIIDDFREQHWFNLQDQMKRVLPDAQWLPVQPGSAVWDSFFRIDENDLMQPGIYGPPVQYLGIFEDNDPNKRLMVVANYNNDVGDAWQWSDQGFLPIELTNEAYKLGVNYVMYALTH